MHDAKQSDDPTSHPHTGKRMSRLGYGTSNLAGRLGRKESLRLLEVAYDAGIRQFDTAPMYGYGAAESVLGEFLKTRRHDIIVTTKFGIEPPRQSPLMSLAKSVARVAVSVVPSVRGMIGRRAVSMVSAGNFSVSHASMSLHRSLAALKTDHINRLLMHEPTVTQITPELLHFLDNTVTKGEIGAYGVAATSLEMPKILETSTPYGTIAQFPEALYDEVAPSMAPGQECILHSIFSARLKTFSIALTQDPALARHASDSLGFDALDTFRLGRLFLWTLLHRSTQTQVLFSSLNPLSIQRNASVEWESEFSAAQSDTLVALLRINAGRASS